MSQYSQYQQTQYHQNRRSNSRNRNYHSSTAFVFKSENTKRARSYKASSTHMSQGSCEIKSKSSTISALSNTETDKLKEKECVKLVTYPIMQVWKI